MGIAAVLRIFFREMPEPVIPFEMYEPLMEVQRNADLERNKRVEAIRRIILGLSPSSTALLCYLIGFLQDIEEHSAVNKMTVSNLAIVFGPNVIRPRVQTVQCALEMPLLQGILQILLNTARISGERNRRNELITRTELVRFPLCMWARSYVPFLLGRKRHPCLSLLF